MCLFHDGPRDFLFILNNFDSHSSIHFHKCIERVYQAFTFKPLCRELRSRILAVDLHRHSALRAVNKNAKRRLSVTATDRSKTAKLRSISQGDLFNNHYAFEFGEKNMRINQVNASGSWWK